MGQLNVARTGNVLFFSICFADRPPGDDTIDFGWIERHCHEDVAHNIALTVVDSVSADYIPSYRGEADISLLTPFLATQPIAKLPRFSQVPHRTSPSFLLEGRCHIADPVTSIGRQSRSWRRFAPLQATAPWNAERPLLEAPRRPGVTWPLRAFLRFLASLLRLR